MAQKILLTLIVVVLLTVAISLGWYYWQINQAPGPTGDVLIPPASDNTNKAPIADNTNVAIDDSDSQQYLSEKHAYTVDYPSNWSMGYVGDSEAGALGVWFVSDEADLKGADGGLPKGAKAEIFVQKISELKEVDEDFPDINEPKDWLDWQREYQASLEMEMWGEPVDKDMTVDGLDAVLTIYDEPTEPEVGKSRKVTLLSPDMNHIFVFQYIGSDSAYTANVDTFDEIVQSFEFRKKPF